MTKRFSFNAADVTRKLGDIQTQLRKARQLVSVLEAEERAHKAYLLDFYDPGPTLVTYSDGTVRRVVLTEYEQFHMDQDAIKADFAARGKRVPYAKSLVTRLLVTIRKVSDA